MDQSSQPVDKKEALKISVDGASSGGQCEGAREGEDEGSEARRRPRLKLGEVDLCWQRFRMARAYGRRTPVR